MYSIPAACVPATRAFSAVSQISSEPTPPTNAGAYTGWTRNAVLSFTADFTGTVPLKLRVAIGDGGASYGIEVVTISAASPRPYLVLPPNTAKISIARVKTSATDDRSAVSIGYCLAAAK